MRWLRVAFGSLTWLLITRTVADPDLWGHLRFGLDMLRDRTAQLVDTYSFTADRPWINHEWLSELLMGAAYACAGPFGLNVLKILAIGTVAGVVVAVARQERASPGARDALVLLTVFATYTRTQVVRPQMFSVALCCILFYLLRQVDRGRIRAIAGVPILFTIWVNLHGGWIVGLAAFGVWTAAALVERRGARTSIILIAAAATAVAATLFNPHGANLWRFLAATVSPDRADISDWKPLLALPHSILAFEAVLPAVALVSLARAGWRVPPRYIAVIGVLVVAAFSVGRVDAFAQAAIGILLAPQILSVLHTCGAGLRAPFWRAPVSRAALATILAASAVGGAWQMRAIEVDGAWVPDPEAAAYLRTHAAGARVLTWFNWGEYALWQLSPAGIRVSMDGRRETVYSDAVLAHHLAFYRGDAAELDYPDRIGADQIWLPADLQVVEALRARGWRASFRTPRSVVLTRGPEALLTSAAPILSTPRIFPWP